MCLRSRLTFVKMPRLHSGEFLLKGFETFYRHFQRTSRVPFEGFPRSTSNDYINTEWPCGIIPSQSILHIPFDVCLMKVHQHLSSNSFYYGGVSEPKDYIKLVLLIYWKNNPSNLFSPIIK